MNKTLVYSATKNINILLLKYRHGQILNILTYRYIMKQHWYFSVPNDNNTKKIQINFRVFMKISWRLFQTNDWNFSSFVQWLKITKIDLLFVVTKNGRFINKAIMHSAPGSTGRRERKMRQFTMTLCKCDIDHDPTFNFIPRIMQVGTALCNWDATPLHKYYLNMVNLIQHKIP